MNITQLMVFSNNMEYDDESPLPIEGAFYAAPSYKKAIFNYFREEEQFDLSKLLSPENDEIENIVLKDNNLVGIKNSDEFLTNKNPDSPTNPNISPSLTCKFIPLTAFTIPSDVKKYVFRFTISISLDL